LVKKYIEGETKEQRKKRKNSEKTQQTVPAETKKEIVYETLDFQPNKKIAFVLGNGVSRKPVNPFLLKNYGVIYGCNAIYREFSPDHLIAVDVKMIKEITDKGYHLSNTVWTNPNRFTREIDKINLFNPNLGWSSGPSALNLASTHGYEEIYILGFDYEGIGNKKDLVNNIYAGTFNYKQLNERATYYGNWTRQTNTCIKRYPNIRYIRVINDVNSFVPDSLIGLKNLTHITVENFKKKFVA
jgi:hypothetical protein